MTPIQQKKAATEFAAFWQPLFERFNIHIDFAYRTFRWDSEAECVAELFKMYQELIK